MQGRMCTYVVSVGALIAGFARTAVAQAPEPEGEIVVPAPETAVYDGDFDPQARQKLDSPPTPITVILPDGTAPAATLVPSAGEGAQILQVDPPPPPPPPALYAPAAVVTAPTAVDVAFVDTVPAPHTGATAPPAPAKETYEFRSSAGAPNPNVWARTGTLAASLVADAGLHIVDPGDSATLVFGRGVPTLASPAATARLRAVVRALPQADTSRAWSRGLTGVRLLVDDGRRRLELALGRDPETGTRRLEVVGASQARALPFAWDNNFHNFLEIERRADGVFVVTAMTSDPIAATRRVGMAYPPEILPPSGGRPGFAWGTVDAGGGVSVWREVRAEVAPQPPANVPLFSSSDTDQIAQPVSLGTASMAGTQPASSIEVP